MITDSTTYVENLTGHENVADGTKAFYFRRPAGFQFSVEQYIDVTLLDPPQTDAQGHKCTFLLLDSPCADHCHSHVLPDRVTGFAAMSVRAEMTFMPGRRRTSKFSRQTCESGLLAA